MTCPRYNDTGSIGERYCDCPAGKIKRDAAIRRLEHILAASDDWRARGCPPGEIASPDDPEVN